MKLFVKSIKYFTRRFLLLAGFNPSAIRKRFQRFEYSFDECDLVFDFLNGSEDSGVVIDVGVAWGSVALPYLKKGWKVYGFEPDLSDSKSRRLSELEAFDNFTLDRRAVSNLSGKELNFYTSEESEGISSLHNFKEHIIDRKVCTVSLKDYFVKNSISKVNFLKIDVEGHERWVLEGLDLDAIRPTFIVLEFDNAKNIPNSFNYKQLGDFLLSSEYTVVKSEWYPIQSYGKRHRFRRLEKYPADLIDPNGWGNFIAIDNRVANDFWEFIVSKIDINYISTNQ